MNCTLKMIKENSCWSSIHLGKGETELFLGKVVKKICNEYTWIKRNAYGTCWEKGKWS